MTKEPWEEELYEEVDVEEESDKPSRKFRASNVISTPVLTVLLGVFFLIVLVIFGVVLYTSNGGGNKHATDGFYGASSSKKVTTKSSSATKEDLSEIEDEEIADGVAGEETSEETMTTKSSNKKKTNRSSRSSNSEDEEVEYETVASNGGTVEVIAGEGAGQIAARSGITVERLQELNPNHMTSGYWYANPGDVVYVN